MEELKPFLTCGKVTLYNGDCLEVLRRMPSESIDSIVTDPPYGLTQNKKGGSGEASLNVNSPAGRSRIGTGGGFMGMKWDSDIPSVEIWQECLRVLKPGGHLLAFAGTRTQHRMACRIEDAGFEIRDMIAWVYGSGFPKSLDVSKAIDKAAGAERELLPTGAPVKRMIPGADQEATGSWIKDNGREYQPVTSEPVTDEAKQWDGWGTALKPSLEPITVARKPFSGTVAQNVIKHGTGAFNIDGCRVPHEESLQVGTGGMPRRREDEESRTDEAKQRRKVNLGGGRVSTKKEGWDRPWKHDEHAIEQAKLRGDAAVAKAEMLGRWPANLIHDGGDEVLACFPQTTSGEPSGVKAAVTKNCYGDYGGGIPVTGFGDSGSAARFFYCAKADQSERGKGNKHPTVKPIDLMRYLVRLVTPKGGTVLDPFSGSGTTGIAAELEFVNAILIERELQYCETAANRLNQPTLAF